MPRLPRPELTSMLRTLDPRTRSAAEHSTDGAAPSDRAVPKAGSAVNIRRRVANAGLATTCAMASLSGVALTAPGPRTPAPPAPTSQSAPVIPASPTYVVGRLKVIDEVDGKTALLPSEQRNAYRMLKAMVERHAQLSEMAATGTQPYAEQTLSGQVERIERLLDLAFPPEDEPTPQMRHGLGLEPAHVKRITEYRLQKFAEKADALGVPVQNLTQSFANLQAPVPESDLILASVFLHELSGKQYSEVVPRDAAGNAQLPPDQLGVLHMLRELDPATRAELRQRVGYTAAPEGTDAREQEVHLGNEVTTPELLGAVTELLKKYAVDPTPLAGGATAETAQGTVKSLRDAIAEEQRRIEEERKRREAEARRPAQPTDAASFYVTSDFGDRFHPIYKEWRLHAGTDLHAPQGVGLNSIYEGRVAFAGYNDGKGYHVVVDHGKRDIDGDGDTERLVSSYAHMSDLDVVKGDTVAKGGHLGEAGSTGSSTAPHLHFELEVDGKLVNPARTFGWS